jgi:hypothetical protein
LLIVLAVTLFNFFVMRASISEKEKELDEYSKMIRDQKLKNSEYSDILSGENLADYYKSVAEESLGYGYYDEKIYIDVTGH